MSNKLTLKEDFMQPLEPFVLEGQQKLQVIAIIFCTAILIVHTDFDATTRVASDFLGICIAGLYFMLHLLHEQLQQGIIY